MPAFLHLKLCPKICSFWMPLRLLQYTRTTVCAPNYNFCWLLWIVLASASNCMKKGTSYRKEIHIFSLFSLSPAYSSQAELETQFSQEHARESQDISRWSRWFHCIQCWCMNVDKKHSLAWGFSSKEYLAFSWGKKKSKIAWLWNLLRSDKIT